MPTRSCWSPPTRGSTIWRSRVRLRCSWTCVGSRAAFRRATDSYGCRAGVFLLPLVRYTEQMGDRGSRVKPEHLAEAAVKIVGGEHVERDFRLSDASGLSGTAEVL